MASFGWIDEKTETEADRKEVGEYQARLGEQTKTTDSKNATYLRDFGKRSWIVNETRTLAYGRYALLGGRLQRKRL